MFTYEQALHLLYEQLPMFHRIGPAAYKPNLDNTIALCKLVGNPEKNLRFVHVAGTNGKGSTSHLIASVLQVAGYKTGLFTSPHLLDFRERIRINGMMIPPQQVTEFVNFYHDSWNKIQPSFFELTAAMALWYFHKEQCDIVIMETGLGGRLDSTNVIIPDVSVITNVGFDHMNLLGDTIEKIATEKGGIIKPGVPVVLGPMRNEASELLRRIAHDRGSTVFETDTTLSVPEMELSGNYQQHNGRTAMVAIGVLQKNSWLISNEAIQEGFAHVVRNTGLRGRWEKLGENPLIIADVAHNEDGIQMVLQQLRTVRFDKLHLVLGMVSDKEIDRVLVLLPKDAIYYFCKADIPRGLDASQLKRDANKFELFGMSCPSVRDAFNAAISASSSRDLVLVSGSVFTVAEVLEFKSM